jgi:hypothetical protein
VFAIVLALMAAGDDPADHLALPPREEPSRR